MSLIPYADHFSPVRRDFWTNLERGLLRSLSSPLGSLRSHLSELDELAKNMHIDKDGFLDIKLDVEHFKPEEINVKTVGNSIFVEAKHEERKDSEAGYVSRRIVRRYDLPEGYQPEEVISKLSSDGVLEIKCPKFQSHEGVLVREISIQPTGPVRMIEKQCDEKCDEKMCDEKKCDEKMCDKEKCDQKKGECAHAEEAHEEKSKEKK